jgi:hypothetical protein
MIAAANPRDTYDHLSVAVCDSARFKQRAMGITEHEVRAVVEYTAAGANADDIKRKFTHAGIMREDIEVMKIASIETMWEVNSDLLDVIRPANEIDNGLTSRRRCMQSWPKTDPSVE